jgi:asparagine synthase (glutamine-hydrolysing)
MCGIFISIGFEPDKRHLDAVTHRGPDGEGWRVFESPAGPVALGHRRLSIIDLEARANQPMCSADERYWLVFNGEIYNYLELRTELQAGGVEFTTTSDAEVLLEAYRAWGADALDRLIGMFAFAIWDDHRKTLFFARDHVGVKPLVYHAAAGGIAFASEIKQFLRLQSFSRRMNLQRVHNFLSNGVTDHLEETTFADAMNFRPGKFLALDLQKWRPGDPLQIQEYWRPPLPDDVTISEADAAEKFRELFYDSIRLQMRADVRVGSCLSGGLDSSAIVCTQAKLWPAESEKLNAVSAVFPGSSVDESQYMDAVIDQTGVNPLRVTFGPETVFDDVEAIAWAQDEPYGSTSIHAQYHVFRTAREAGVKVMLDGQGADETMGGYHGCFHFHYARLVRQLRLIEFIQTLAERKAWHGLDYRTQLAPFAGRLPAPLQRLVAPTATAVPPMPDWLGSDILRANAPIEGSVLAQAIAINDLPPAKTLGEYCVALVQTTNLPMLLRYEDRSSMAHGIEARVPFLDHRLVEFLLRLGHQHKIVGGDTKRVLRSAMGDVLPEMILNRRDKLGFATPEEAWFKGPLRKKIEAGVEDMLDLYPELLVPDATRKFARQMLDGERPFDFTLWRIVVFGIWGRVFGAYY